MPSDLEMQRVRLRRRALGTADPHPRGSGPHHFLRRCVTGAPMASNNPTCPLRPVALHRTSMQASSFRCGPQ
jgi:hypothetical protein